VSKRCPTCDRIGTSVIDTRATEGGNAIKRRRQCLTCGARFNTREAAVECVEVVPITRAVVVHHTVRS
jgi:transcriptional repressor NrdR